MLGGGLRDPLPSFLPLVCSKPPPGHEAAAMAGLSAPQHPEKHQFSGEPGKVAPEFQKLRGIPLIFLSFFLLPPCPQTTPVVQKHNTVHGEKINQTQRNQNRPAEGLGKYPCVQRGLGTSRGERAQKEGLARMHVRGLSPRLLPSCVCREQSRGSTTKPLRPERTPKSLPAARATGLAVRT